MRGSIKQSALFAVADRGSATISPCGLYRYDLTREWGPRDEARKWVVFCMLNPSKADADRPDPTMTRCRNYAEAWGYDAMAIVNLFAFRATDPPDMWAATDPVGPDNGKALIRWSALADLFVCAWGAVPKGLGQERADNVLEFLWEFGTIPHAIQLTKDGHPGHPLFLRSSLRPFPMKDTRKEASRP